MKKYRSRLHFGKKDYTYYGNLVHSAATKEKRRKRRWLGLLLSVLTVCLLGSAIFASHFFFDPYSTGHTSFLSYQSTGAASNSKVIVLDPGRGGSDPGTVWGDVYEKDINLAIAEKLEKILQDAGHTVIMTRTDDTSVFLRERVQRAEYNHADIFVSVHQNALENDTITSGIEVYCNEYSNQNSPALASAIHNALLQETGAVDQGVETASNLFVVRRCSVPACLVETGFLTSAEERQLLLSDQYQQKIAVGIANGIETYLQMAANGGQ